MAGRIPPSPPKSEPFRVIELAHYLNMKNWAAEEPLRQGKIRFKWMGKRKVIDKKDAGAYFDSLPDTEIQIKATEA